MSSSTTMEKALTYVSNGPMQVWTWTIDSPKQAANTTDSTSWTDSYVAVLVSCYDSYDHGFMGGMNV
jgi:hypothetical protein